MSTRQTNDTGHHLYFCTFTCFRWIPLFEITNSYDCVYKWFWYLRESKSIDVICYVIMPNHIHLILHLPDHKHPLNKIISNGKRFMAYEIGKRLGKNGRIDVLEELHGAVTRREERKGQLHRVFEEFFDAKAIYSNHFLFQKMDYIHHNPVIGKWNLAVDFVAYEHSSASFYDTGKFSFFKPRHYSDL